MTDAGSSDTPSSLGGIAVAAIAAVCAVSFAWGGVDFCLDDAWIHLAYAKSLRAGDGFSYNPGDWETGSSSPLWALILALFPMERAPIEVAKGLGIVFHAATAALAWRLAVVLARRLRLRAASVRHAGIAAGALVAVQPTLLQAASSGMEVSLASALVLAGAYSVWSERTPPWLAFFVGASAVWARPEALFFFALVCAGAWRSAPHARTVACVFAGALAALACWVIYCFVVSGHPWPNTRYVKATGGDLSGLWYVLVQVLPRQPWLVGVGGAALAITAGFRAARAREWAPLVLLGAWIGTVVAIALGRRLDPQVFFYLSRYFDPVAAVPAVVAGLGFACSRRGLGAMALGPVALVAVYQAIELRELVRAQEDDIRVLHTEPAHVIAAALPPGATVVVEGAGASRFFAPRTMTIVDMIGLNDRALAHAGDDDARACSLVRRRATHVLVPDRYLPAAMALFELRPIRAFIDERNAQTAAFAPRRVFLAEVLGLNTPWRERCHARDLESDGSR